jgi:hypothetical protein
MDAVTPFGYTKPMPGLFCNVDGIAAILFHVEHSGASLWHYRWRLIGNLPAPYLVWREKTSRAKIVRIHSEVRGAAIEVEWREEVDSGELIVDGHREDEEAPFAAGSAGLQPAAEHPSSSSPSTINPQPSTHLWLPVSLFTFTPGSARFSVTSERDFISDDEFAVCAPVRNDGVAAYRFPAMELEAGVTAEVVAHADAPALPNLLLESGEFRPRIAGMSITNLTPSEDSWQEVVDHSGPFTLTRCPLAAARRWFAVGRDSVNPALIAQP